MTDYRRYHLSDDLEQVVQGKVSKAIELLETSTMSTEPIKENATKEKLEQLLKEQCESSARLQQQVEAMRLRNEVEAERK